MKAIGVRMSANDANSTIEEAMQEVARRLIEESTPMPPEFSKVVDEQFWDLLLPLTDVGRK